MEMNSKIDSLLHQQQLMMQESSVTNTPRLPAGVVLPLQTVDKLQALDRRLLASPADKQTLVCTPLTYCYQRARGCIRLSVHSFAIYVLAHLPPRYDVN